MKNKNRESWRDYFIGIAKQIATRSTCFRRDVGAVIVKEKNILATGYNGAPMGMEHCLTRGCIKDEMNLGHYVGNEYCRAVHAEQNAICQAARFGNPVDGATLYITDVPCGVCAKIIINSGITRVEYPFGGFNTWDWSYENNPAPYASTQIKEDFLAFCLKHTETMKNRKNDGFGSPINGSFGSDRNFGK